MIGGALLLLVAAPTSYAHADRVAYIGEAIEAFDDATPQEIEDLEQYLYAVHKNQCHAPLVSLMVDCLMEAARRNCNQWPQRRRKTCDRISDVIMSNRLSEKRFISRRLRYEIMLRSGSFRQRLREELHRRHATLVAELMVSEPPGEALPEAIDRFCIDRTRWHDLAWQHCVSVIAWFIGTAESAP